MASCVSRRYPFRSMPKWRRKATAPLLKPCTTYSYVGGVACGKRRRHPTKTARCETKLRPNLPSGIHHDMTHQVSPTIMIKVLLQWKRATSSQRCIVMRVVVNYTGTYLTPSRRTECVKRWPTYCCKAQHGYDTYYCSTESSDARWLGRRDASIRSLQGSIHLKSPE